MQNWFHAPSSQNHKITSNFFLLVFSNKIKSTKTRIHKNCENCVEFNYKAI